MLQSLLGSVKQTGSIDLQDDYIQNPLFVGGFSLFFWVVVFYMASLTIKDKESACGGDPDSFTLR